MTNKKIVKKIRNNMKTKPIPRCTIKNSSSHKSILILIIIILTWWKPMGIWSQITITIATILILLSAHNCSYEN